MATAIVMVQFACEFIVTNGLQHLVFILIDNTHTMCLTESYGYFWTLVQNLLPAGNITTSNFLLKKMLKKTTHIYYAKKHSAAIIDIV